MNQRSLSVLLGCGLILAAPIPALAIGDITCETPETAGVVEGGIDTRTAGETIKASLEVNVGAAEVVRRQGGACIGVDYY